MNVIKNSIEGWIKEVERRKNEDPEHSREILKKLQEMSLSEWCLSLVGRAHKTGISLTSLEIFRILKEAYEIQTSVDLVMVSLRELVEKELVLENQRNGSSTYSLTEKGRNHMLQLQVNAMAENDDG